MEQGFNTTASSIAHDSIENIKGKTFIVTGASTGLGFEAARVLLLNGGKVILACRDVNKAKSKIITIGNYESLPQDIIPLDLASKQSIQDFDKVLREKVTVIDCLINNAGMWAEEKQLNEDGYEMTFATNHLGHFLLTSLCIDLIPKGGKIVNLSSGMHNMQYQGEGMDFGDINCEKQYEKSKSQGSSKVANILFTNMLAVKQPHIQSFSVHPGVIKTELHRQDPNFAKTIASLPVTNIKYKNIEEGTSTTLQAAVSNESLQQNGCYLVDCKRETQMISKFAQDNEEGMHNKNGIKLWELSIEMTGASWI